MRVDVSDKTYSVHNRPDIPMRVDVSDKTYSVHNRPDIPVRVDVSDKTYSVHNRYPKCSFLGTGRFTMLP